MGARRPLFCSLTDPEGEGGGGKLRSEGVQSCPHCTSKPGRETEVAQGQAVLCWTNPGPQFPWEGEVGASLPIRLMDGCRLRPAGGASRLVPNRGTPPNGGTPLSLRPGGLTPATQGAHRFSFPSSLFLGLNLTLIIS